MSLCLVCQKDKIFFTRLNLCKKCYDSGEKSVKITKSHIPIQENVYETTKTTWKARRNSSRKKYRERYYFTEKQIGLVKLLGGDISDAKDFHMRPNEYVDSLITALGDEHKATPSQKNVLRDLDYGGSMNLNMREARDKIEELLWDRLGSDYDTSKSVWKNFQYYLKIRKSSSGRIAANRDNYSDWFSEDEEEEETCEYCCNAGCETCNKCPNCIGKGCEICDETGDFQRYQASLVHSTLPDCPDDDEVDLDKDEGITEAQEEDYLIENYEEIDDEED
tara:strand:- start:77 stop:910 length:834 start_codon:yes stop_codon:yes gene_type:complete